MSDVKGDKVAEAQSSDTTDYLEFVGMEPYGTEFYKGEHGTHTISKAHMKEHHDIDLGSKEVVWRKRADGRMLVPIADISPQAVAVLEKDPMFKRVSI